MWKCCAEWLYYYLGYITNSSVGVCPGTPLKRFVTPKPPFICKYENSFRTISASDPVYRFLLNGEAKFFLGELIYLYKLRMHLINFARIISHFSEKKRSWNQFKNVSMSRPRRPRPVRGEQPSVQPVLTTSLYRDKRPRKIEPWLVFSFVFLFLHSLHDVSRQSKIAPLAAIIQKRWT